jgi:PAS domain S-box-containing protein
MREPASKTVLRYGLAVTAVAAVLVTTLVQNRIQSPLAFNAQLCLIAIAITFWYAGTGPGLVALVLSCGMVSVLIRGHIIGSDFALTQFTAFTVFFSLLILWFSGVRRRAERLLTEARDNLERRVVERTAKLQEANSELQKMQYELWQSEAYLKDAQRLARLGTWVWQVPGGESVYLSDEWYRIWGFNPEDGLPSLEQQLERIHPEERPRYAGIVQRTIDEQTDYEVEFRICLPTGAIRHLHTVGHPIWNDSRELVKFLGVTSDITERKLAQEENERLRKLEADLAHTNRVSVMGEMAASIVHEVKTPIATARNYARAAQNFLDRLPPALTEVREALKCIVDSADRAGNLIDRIRDHVRKAPPRKDRFDLNQAINEVMLLARREFIKNGVSVKTRLTEASLVVEGDRVQLQQVVMNLILNAVEAMSAVDRESRELVISSDSSQTAGVLFAARDSGPGISPEHLERVFEPFYTTKSSGTGIGLSICRSIIDAHGGRLWVELNEPRGAIFQFAVPGIVDRKAQDGSPDSRAEQRHRIRT